MRSSVAKRLRKQANVGEKVLYIQEKKTGMVIVAPESPRSLYLDLKKMYKLKEEV